MMRAADLAGAHVPAFCQRVAPGQHPRAVYWQPQLGQPLRECFGIVPAQVAVGGGEQVVGWALWEYPGVFIEAEFHAVWRDPAGELLDLTPRPLADRFTSFLPDPDREYLGERVDNIRQALVKDADVTRFLYLAGRRVEIQNLGALARENGKVALFGKLLREMTALAKEAERLQRRIAARFPAQPD